jgi:predicted O-methyltransferase YrrM
MDHGALAALLLPRPTSSIRKPIDLLFIDADKEGYLDYLNKLLPLLQSGAQILHPVNLTASRINKQDRRVLLWLLI